MTWLLLVKLIRKSLRELQTTKQHKNYLPEHWQRETHLMAIVNITEDSFSDGGLFLDLTSAINHASLCIKQGADILEQIFAPRESLAQASEQDDDTFVRMQRNLRGLKAAENRRTGRP